MNGLAALGVTLAVAGCGSGSSGGESSSGPTPKETWSASLTGIQVECDKTRFTFPVKDSVTIHSRSDTEFDATVGGTIVARADVHPNEQAADTEAQKEITFRPGPYVTGVEAGASELRTFDLTFGGKIYNLSVQLGHNAVTATCGHP